MEATKKNFKSIYTSISSVFNRKFRMVETSVADPDPDPVGSGLFGSPGSGSGKIPDPGPDPLSTKRPLEF